MKKIWMLMMVGMFSLLVFANHSEAATILIANPACEKGNDVYCSYNMGGLRMGIVKIDKVTKKITKVVSFKNKNEDTNGFYDLNIKGNAIYASYDLVCGTGGSDSYIYKIDLKKKKKIRLGKGKSPIVIGKKIYYIKTKFNKEYGEDYSKGIYSMDLSGKHVKKIAKMPFKWVNELGTDGKHLIIDKYGEKNIQFYSMTKNGKNLKKIKVDESAYLNPGINSSKTQAGWNYYIKDAAVFRRNLHTNEVQEVVDFGTGDYSKVDCVTVLGGVLMVRGSRDEYIEEFGYNGGKGYIFMIDLSDLSRTVVETHNCGE